MVQPFAESPSKIGCFITDAGAGASAGRAAFAQYEVLVTSRPSLIHRKSGVAQAA
jgi:hypothetical protein